MVTLGAKIRQAREAAGLSQSALARLVDVTRRAVSMWEADDREPRFLSVIDIAKATGQPIEFFVMEEVHEGDSAADTAVHR